MHSDGPAEEQRQSSFGGTRWVTPGEEIPLRYVLPPALPGTEFMFARHCQRRWRVFHESFAICLCMRASADFFYRGRLRGPLRDQCFMLLEPGETHINLKIPAPQTYVAVRMAPQLFTNAALELGVRPGPHFGYVLGQEPSIRRAFEQLTTSVADGADVLEQQSRLAHGLRLLMEQCIERPRIPASRADMSRAAIERCKDYIRQRHNRAITLDELAKLAGLSRFQLLRAFARRTGTPPHAYQILVRIEHACKLLQSGLRPSMVASLVGFADQSHLTRHFRRTMFVTPGAYRAAHG